MRVSLSENISKILCLEPNLCMGSTVVCTTRTDIVFFVSIASFPHLFPSKAAYMSGDKLVLYVWITTHGNSVLTCWYRTDKLPVVLQAWKGPLEKGSRCWNFSHSRSSACSFLKTNQNKVLNDEAKPKPLAQELIGQCGSFESDRDGFHSNATKTYQVFPNLPAGASICNLDIGEICWYWWICWWFWTCCVLVSPTLDNPTWLSYFGNPQRIGRYATTPMASYPASQQLRSQEIHGKLDGIHIFHHFSPCFIWGNTWKCSTNLDGICKATHAL